MLSLLTPLNVNCHASDGRKSTPLHLAAGYNRTRIVQLLLQHGADVHAKVSAYFYLSVRKGFHLRFCCFYNPLGQCYGYALTLCGSKSNPSDGCGSNEVP
jgi:ankyrin repeat protein